MDNSAEVFAKLSNLCARPSFYNCIRSYPSQFRPLVEKELWHGEKFNIGINRGLYEGPQEFVKAMAENKAKFIRAYARPRMNYARSLTEPESPDEMPNLLDKYLQLTAAMTISLLSSPPLDAGAYRLIRFLARSESTDHESVSGSVERSESPVITDNSHERSVLGGPVDREAELWALWESLDSTFKVWETTISKADLYKAVRTGALCVVVRSEFWKPKEGDSITGVKIKHLDESTDHNAVTKSEKSLLSPTTGPNALKKFSWAVEIPEMFQEGNISPLVKSNRTIHGVHRMPEYSEYAFAILPSNGFVESNNKDIVISHPQGVIQAIVSIVQICFATATLYNSRGNQIDQYGYAAFGLSVLPYVIMSIVNLLGNVLTPDFATLYLVRSLEMEEAEKRGYRFEGIIVAPSTDVGTHSTSNDQADAIRIEESAFVEWYENLSTIDLMRILNGDKIAGVTTDLHIPAATHFKTEGPRVWSGRKYRIIMGFITCIMMPIPFAVVAGLTHYHPGHSTTS
ncbi:hypothetical protein B7463_g5186, partial [Scytalidium lignicola]